MPTTPLAGRRVVVTRAEHQAGELVDLLNAAGATVERLPLLALLPPEDPAPLAAAASSLASYRWVVFTSANAVRALFAAFDDRWPNRVAVAAIGDATDAALCADAVWPDIVAADNSAEGLLAELLPRLRYQPGERILLPQAADARPTLAEGLRAAGHEVDTVVAYRKTVPPDARERAAAIFGNGPLGWVTFTSPSIVRTFAGLFEPRWNDRRGTLRAASIGPVTSEALRTLGVPAAAEAARASDEALVAAIVAAVSGSASIPSSHRR
ncbi:MAG TPA: uroporphyrinogen-III synthase [Thermoanaerobaculia bacterium]|nr:uroporphyrinogen-III synthase [Thermoanaerobaculia bacterium]